MLEHIRPYLVREDMFMPPWEGIGHAVINMNKELAQYFLGFNTKNRRTIGLNVRRLGLAIARHEWLYNGIPICISDTHRLLNGQHRIKTVIANGGEISTMLIWGLDEAVWPTYDTNSIRKLTSHIGMCIDYGDIVGKPGEYNTAINHLVSLESGRMQLKTMNKGLADLGHITLNDQIDVFDHHSSDLNASMYAVKNLCGPGKTLGYGGKGLWSALHTLFSRYNRKKTDEFFSIMSSCDRAYENHPAQHLVRKVAKFNGWEHRREAHATIAGLAVRAFNACAVYKADSVRDVSFDLHEEVTVPMVGV